MNDDKCVRAAELALGLLEAGDQNDALHEVTADPEMRQAFRMWNERLAPLCADAVEVAPGAHVLANVEAVLFDAAPEAGARSFLGSLLDMIRAPENRGLVVTALAAKAMLVAWILYLFL
ncbi:MAG: hypothetical protein GYB53_17700 [Rhodobacteraceae bacterium]|nr:hypothetical protein [Paracoccaceae bacterium]MBR9821836.1 hypothetical protein [Paracoccaceae bacterium]